MGPQPSMAAEWPATMPAPDRLVDRLLGLYAEEAGLYRRVRDLSRHQLEAVRGGAELAEVRRLLAEKKACLDSVDRLEQTEKQSKEIWRAERDRCRPESRGRLHRALQEITGLIEEIIRCEEKCDTELVRRAKGDAWTQS